jgi:hypothetical protein
MRGRRREYSRRRAARSHGRNRARGLQSDRAARLAPDANSREAIVYPSQDIGTVRGELVHRALAGQRIRLTHKGDAAAEDEDLRELLDQAHARIRFLERAIRRLTTAL